jgi:cytochrome c biogenesis protein CcmG/thiol:disulfide interchange protein DsbE
MHEAGADLAAAGAVRLVFALVTSGLVKPGDRMVHSAMVGKPMPDLKLPALFPGKGGVAAADFGKGKPRLLNVFASWCIPCIAEAPQLMKLKAAGAEIDAVAVRDTPAAVQAFLKQNGDPYTRIGDDKAERRRSWRSGRRACPRPS